MKHKRINSKKLASNLISVEKNRQPDMTELMLNDIDQHGKSKSVNGKNGCTFRLSPLTGCYFVTGKDDKKNPWGTVQLGWSAKVRLCELTGGKVVTKTVNGKQSKMLIGGAFSDQDFRRCFDYVKGCGDWVAVKRDEPGDFAVFEVDTNKVNDAIRDGARWDSLHVNVSSGPTKRKQKTTISIKHPTLDKPEFKSGKFTSKAKAKEYYRDVLIHVVGLMKKGDIAVQCSIDSRNI